MFIDRDGFGYKAVALNRVEDERNIYCTVLGL